MPLRTLRERAQPHPNKKKPENTMFRASQIIMASRVAPRIHPFTAPIAKPEIKNFWKVMYTIVTGMVEINTPAVNRLYLV